MAITPGACEGAGMLKRCGYALGTCSGGECVIEALRAAAAPQLMLPDFTIACKCPHRIPPEWPAIVERLPRGRRRDWKVGNPYQKGGG